MITPHFPAKLKNVNLQIIKDFLEKDKTFHASQGMYLEHHWKNTEDENEVQFLFRINDVEQTKALIHKLPSNT